VKQRTPAHSPVLCYISNIMASRSVNKVILVGHLGQDAETRFTPSGVPVTSFSVATSRRWKDQQTNEWKEETNWSNIVLWRAENVAPYLTKGKQVYVEGRLQTRSYDDKDNKKVYRTEVVAEDVILLSGGAGRGEEESGGARGAGATGGGTRTSSSAARSGAGKPAAAAGDDPFGGPNITDDDVPF
jgi:single-strand DNA-binding protein